MEVDGNTFLLPLDKEHHDNITILRTLIDQEHKVLTLFLKDTTYVDTIEDEFFMAGFLAICERLPDEDFYVTIVYHEWFIIDEHVQTI